MRISNIFLVFLVPVIILQACSEDPDSRVFKHNAVGTPGDVLVVMSDALWEGQAGDSLRKYLETEYLLLPQIEPAFYLSQIPHNAHGKTTQRSRNLIIARTSQEFEKSGIAIEHDVWARPQLVVRLRAKNKEELLELISRNGEAITAQFEQATLSRQAAAFKNTPNTKVISRLREKLNIHLNIPAHFNLDEETENFIWIRNETPRLSQGILIWSYPYQSEKQLTLDRLVEVRDSVTMRNVPGPQPESFMTTEKRVPPVYKTKKLNDNFCAEIRGLWRVEGAFMGGPFVNYSVIDEKRQRIVTIDAFVYAGMQEKRNFVREVDAIASTLKFID